MSGLRRSGNGHLYFSLKDAEAQLDCVLFSREATRLKFSLEEGMAVRCRGRLTLYEARGKFQMSVADDRADRRGRARARVRAAQAAAGRRGAVRSGAQAAAAVPAPPDRRGDVGVGRRHPRHRPRRAPPLPDPDPAGGHAGAGRRRRAGHRGGDPPAGGGRRRRRHHRRARRRLAGGPVGVQRGAGGARDLRLPRPGDLRGRPRDRLHDRRFRRRPARADAVGRRRARGPGARPTWWRS